MIYKYIIVACWAVFILFWAISAIWVKKDIGSKKFLQQGGFNWTIRLVILLVIAVAVFERVAGRYSASPVHHPIFDYLTNTYIGSLSLGLGISGMLGSVLCILGIGFAIWARIHLGRNWSSYPTTKEGHELVTSGPYRFVRHPIYTGILLATFGSVLAVSLLWFVPFAAQLAVFLNRVRVEDKLMSELFPDQFPGYKKRTKALIPFVW